MLTKYIINIFKIAIIYIKNTLYKYEDRETRESVKRPPHREKRKHTRELKTRETEESNLKFFTHTTYLPHYTLLLHYKARNRTDFIPQLRVFTQDLFFCFFAYEVCRSVQNVLE